MIVSDKISKQRLISICRLIGRSGINQKCPGNPDCEIFNSKKGKVLRSEQGAVRAA